MVALIALMGALLAACSNAPDAATISSGPTPGITPTQVSVGALATLSGPISADFAPIVSGVKAYFDWVDAHGGVWGRKVVLTHEADDGGVPSNNAVEARTLVEQDHVFAVVGVGTAFFTGASFLAQTGTPTYGYATENDWEGPKNLFAAYGSVQEYSTSGPAFAYVAHELGSHSVALLAYGVPQSAAECAAATTSLAALGIHVGYTDLSIPYGGDMSSDVLRMRQAKTDLIISCMDVTGNVELARTMEQNGLDGVAQIWLDGYDTSTLDQYAPLMKRTYFLVQHVPFQAAAQIPGAFPGLENYLAVMHRYAPAQATSEVAMEGWLSADLFVQGLRAAGPHPTQAAVVKADNEIHDYTGGGLATPTDWAISHTTLTPPSCESYVETSTDAQGHPVFKVVFNHGSQIWVCFPIRVRANLDHPVPPPPGSPGG